MIRYIACLKKKDEISDYEFRKNLEGSELTELISQVTSLFQASKYRLKMALKISAQSMLQERIKGTQQPYDAILEIVWTEPVEILEIYNTEEAQSLINALDKKIHEFVCRKSSTGLFTDYILEDSTRPK